MNPTCRMEAARAFTRLDDLAKEEAAAIAALPFGPRRRQGYVPKKHGAAPARREVLVAGKSWDGPKAGYGEQCLDVHGSPLIKDLATCSNG